MIVCFQMVIRAALLCAGLFLIEAWQNRAQLAADQLALPTYLPECCCSHWRHLFYHYRSLTSLLFCPLGSCSQCQPSPREVEYLFKLIIRCLSVCLKYAGLPLCTDSDAAIVQRSLSLNRFQTQTGRLLMCWCCCSGGQHSFCVSMCVQQRMFCACVRLWGNKRLTWAQCSTKMV